MEWKWLEEKRTKKERMSKSKTKKFVIMFFDICGIILKHWVRRGETVNAVNYECRNNYGEQLRQKGLIYGKQTIGCFITITLQHIIWSKTWPPLGTGLPGSCDNAASADASRWSVVTNAISIYVKWTCLRKVVKKSGIGLSVWNFFH